MKAPKTEGLKRSAWLTAASNPDGVEGEAIEAGDPKLFKLLKPAGLVKLCSEVDPIGLLESGLSSSSSSRSSSTSETLFVGPCPFLCRCKFSELCPTPPGPDAVVIPDSPASPAWLGLPWPPPLFPLPSTKFCTRMHFFFRLKWKEGSTYVFKHICKMISYLPLYTLPQCNTLPMYES